MLKRLSGSEPVKLDDSALNALIQYEFPGNVRELENILERAVTLSMGNTISHSDLQLPKTPQSNAVTAEPEPVTKTQISSDLNNFIESQQREVIIKAIEETKWNRTAVAKLLGVSFRALRYRVKN